MLSKFNDNASVADIIKDGNILATIRWMQHAPKDDSPSTVKRVFRNVVFAKLMMI